MIASSRSAERKNNWYIWSNENIILELLPGVYIFRYIDIYLGLLKGDDYISKLLKGVMYEACRSAGIVVHFFDTHAEVQA